MPPLPDPSESMSNKAVGATTLLVLMMLIPVFSRAQCFASPGNPVGGASNMGVMNKNAFRVMSFYRYQLSLRYFQGNELYTESNRPLSSANYNYQGLLLGYGLTDRFTLESEFGYFYNKTQHYRFNHAVLNGFGLSNTLLSLKYGFLQNNDKRFEISGAAGLNIPFRRTMMSVDGVTLPVDLQPSTASYGITLQSFIVKENSFSSMRYFWVNRYEINFENPQGYVFGKVFSSSVFVSRHFTFGEGRWKDWTLILQGRFQMKEKNTRDGNIVLASGGHSVMFAPQVNFSPGENWNISLVFERPLYQYLNSIQLGSQYAVLLNMSRDFSIKKAKNEK
jgi:hypothetical protein